MAVRLVPLASGSHGNAALVEMGSTRLLIDAGLSARRLTEGLNAAGVPGRSVDAVLLTHEHEDHVRGVERFSRMHRVPVVCSMETVEAMDRSPIHFSAWHPLMSGGSTEIGEVQVESFPVPHDAVAPVGFVLRGEGLRVGVATDVGHATSLVVERLRGCDVLMIEANHDERMLRDGPYPWHLKQRVGGRLGHLSNGEAASLLERTVGQGCRAVVLAHLSARNNTPELARRAAWHALSRGPARAVEMHVALPDTPSAPVHVESSRAVSSGGKPS